MKKWPIWFGALSLILWLSYAMLALSTDAPNWLPEIFRLPRDESSTILARRGQFGDAFGAFNALISTFALIGLFFTIRSQQQQLTEQEKASRTSEKLTHQQQFQEQYYRGVDAYRSLLTDFTMFRDGVDGEAVHGRPALWLIWREQLIAHVRSDSGTMFHSALCRQLEAYSNEGLGQWNSNADALSAVRALRDQLTVEPEVLDELVDSVGQAWRAVYGMYRYQFDSLFRAWYTVYRILDTASNYGLSDESIRLYAATYRAQLSWIEMAFLLINQSGLPENPAFPRACHLSNRYAVFDNLDVDSDVVVSVLVALALRRVSSGDRDSAMLDAHAFKSA